VALFGKPDTLSTLLKKIKGDEYRNTEELNNWLARIGADLDLKARQIVWMVGHHKREVRDFGKHRLEELKDSSIVDLLMKEMERKSPARRLEIAKLAMNLNPRKVFGHIGRMLQSQKLDSRLGALDLIAARPNLVDYIGYLKAGLKDPESRIRQKAVSLLCKIPEDPTVFLILRNLLHDEEDAIRKMAIEALAKKSDPDIVEPFLERLPFEEPREQSLMVRALTLLARNTEAKLEDRLLPMLADENSLVRDSAVKLLREIPNRTQVIRTFLCFSKELAYWLRDRTFHSFKKMTKDFIDPLLELMEDRDPEIRVGAMIMAADSSDPRIIPSLQKIFLGKDDWWVRVIAADLMARFPFPEVVEILISKLHDPDIRYSVVSALGTIESPRVIRPLIECLDDPQASIRMATLDALENQKYPDVADALARVALTDTEPVVQDKALFILENLGKAGTQQLEKVLDVQKKKLEEAPEEPEEELELEMENPSLSF